MPYVPVSRVQRGRKRRPRWQRRLEQWWFTYVRPPGSPNLWLLVIPFMIAGAVAVAWLAGTIAGEDLATMARNLVKNPFKPPKP